MTMQESSEHIKHNKVLVRWHKKFAEVQREILNIGPFRKGSICKVWNVCGNPGCRCKKSEKFHHGPYFLWTTKVKSKTVTLKVPENFLPRAQHYLDNSKHLAKALKKLAMISDKIVKKEIELNKHFSR